MTESPTLLEYSEEPTKFAIVGIIGVIVNYIVVYFVIEILHGSDAIALALSIYISMSSNYILNRVWTFESTSPIFPEYISYLFSNLIGGLIQWGSALFIERWFENYEYTEMMIFVINIPTIYFATTIGIGLGFVSNYLLSKYFVF